MASTTELACIYATLHDDEVKITEDRIQTMLESAGVNVVPFWPGPKTHEGVYVKVGSEGGIGIVWHS